MDISRECGAFNRFNMIWANLIQNLTNKRSVIQHLCGSLVQVFPSLMLQKCSNNDKDNIDALNRRLSSWEECEFDLLLSEAENIQRKFDNKQRKKQTNKKASKNKLQFLQAVENGQIRKATQYIDPDNYGLNSWSSEIKNELKLKYLNVNTLSTDKNSKDPLFHSTKINGSTIY